MQLESAQILSFGASSLDAIGRTPFLTEYLMMIPPGDIMITWKTFSLLPVRCNSGLDSVVNPLGRCEKLNKGYTLQGPGEPHGGRIQVHILRSSPYPAGKGQFQVSILRKHPGRQVHPVPGPGSDVQMP